MIDRKNVANLYPLTALQEGILYHLLRDSGSRAYYERLEFGLDGALDVDAWRGAWQDLTDRHDMLRTVFAVRNTPRPLQVVLRHWPVSFVFEDLSGLSAPEARARIDAHKAADLARGFSPTAEVPMRIALFRRSAHEHRVVWSFSHLLLDGWCLGILQREFDTCYLARISGAGASLPPAPRFADHVRWLAGRDREADAAFWHDLLDGFAEPTPAPVRLSERFAHPSTVSARGEQVLPLTPQAEEALAELARAGGTTRSTVVQALWGLVLAGSHGCRDAVFASTVSGRPADVSGADATIGLFINAVPVRVRFDDDDTLGALLRRVHEQAVAASAHHTAPLPDIQAAHPLRAALTDHVVVIENYPDAPPSADPRLPRPRTDDLDLHEHTHYGFEFQFLPGNGDGTAARLRFRFDLQRHAPEGVRLLGERFLDLLRKPLSAGVDTALADCFPTWRGPRRIALAASFTAEPVAEAARAWLRQFGQPGRIALAPYNQTARALIDADSPLAHAALAVLVYRPEDALRDLIDEGGFDDPATADRLEAGLQSMCAALSRWLAREARPPLVVVLVPPTLDPDVPTTLTSRLKALSRAWRAALEAAACADLTIVDIEAPQTATGLPAAAWADPVGWRIGHLPYTGAGCAALGAVVARSVLARARAPYKVIAVDCDNTLWEGICGEAGPLGVRIGAPQRALQRFLIERQQQGFLVVLASKNSPDDVWAVFDRHPDMLLRREHLSGAAIDWEPKSGNLRRLASELGLGLDSFMFIDDSAAEIAEVAHGCPEVLTLQLPAGVDLVRWLALIWAGDRATVTDEDRERTRMMQAEASRRVLQAGSTDLDDFLAGIGLVLRIGPMAAHQRARMAQLTQRTNQFNLSGRRYDETALSDLAAQPDTLVLAVEVEDRFGAYGLTGVLIARQDIAKLAAAPSDERVPTLWIDTLLLSCRVLGRRVEHGILHALAQHAAARGLERIAAPLVITARNQPVRDFLAGAPWHTAADGLHCCRVADALAPPRGITLHTDWQFTPAPRQTAAAVRADEDPLNRQQPDRSWGADSDSESGPELLALPQSLPADDAVHARELLPMLAAGAGWPHRVPAALAAPILARKATNGIDARAEALPRTPTEARLAALWAEVLQSIDSVPVDTGFADLGGHSLHAVRVVSRIERDFGLRVTLDRFLELDTIRALAGWIEQAGRQPVPEASTGAVPNAMLESASGLGTGARHRIERLPDTVHAPLSPAQQRIWLLTRLGNAPLAYNQCAAWRVRGALDPDALEAAIGSVIARHESLRTRYPFVDGLPRQRVEPCDAPRLVRLSVSNGAGLVERIARDARQAFDLETEPPIRFRLYRLAENEHALAVIMHHIAGDGWSFGLLLADLARALRGEPLPGAPTLRYRDYAAWSRSPAFEAWVADDRAHWLAQLGRGEGLPEIATMPTDTPRPSAPSGRGGQLHQSFPLTDRAALDRLLASQRASPFQWLAALVALLLARHSAAFADGGEAVPVRLGSPVAGRDQPEFEPVIGIFVNTLVLAAGIDPSASFRQLLAALRETAVAALAHPRYPFDRLVDALAPRRDPSRNPLFDVLVALQDAPRPAADVPGLAFEALPVPLGVAALDLAFEFVDFGDRIDLQLTWSDDLYDAATAQRFADRLGHLMQASLAAPDAPLAALPWPSPEESAQLARLAAGPQRALPTQGLADRFLASAALQPDAVALLAGGVTLSFAELACRANALAHRIAAAGVTPGDRVAVLLPRDARWPIALLAILRAGAVYLPLEPRHPPARISEILADAEPRLLIADTALAAALGEPAPCPFIEPEPIPIDRDIPFDPDRNAGAVAAPAPPADATPSARSASFPLTDTPAYLLYTSGSTGRPKGVLVGERAFVNMIDAQIEAFAVGPDDIVLQQASCAFDASLSELFMGWLAGAPVALADAATVDDPDRLGRFLHHHQVSVATFTPSYLRLLDDHELSGLRALIVAGEAVHGRDIARPVKLGITVFNAYGPTETAVCATLGRVAAVPADDAPVPIGRPLANLTLALRDAQGNPAPIGVPAELTVFGPGVAIGYWRRPALEAERFVTDTRFGRGYRTGDLARWREDGSLEYLGRTDDMMKLRGLRIEPGEIAARLRALPGVVQAAVTAEAGPTGERLVAWLSPAGLDIATMRAALSAQLPAYMVPEQWRCLPELPLSTSGKLDRKALSLSATQSAASMPPSLGPESSRGQPPSPGQRNAPGQAMPVDLARRPAPEPASSSDPELTIILAVFRRLLDTEVDADSDFFACGGNSLAAMLAAREISRELARPCPAMLVFRHPTAGALTRALGLEAGAPGGWSRWGNPRGQPMLALPPAPGLGAVYAQLAARLPDTRILAPDFDGERPIAEQLEQWADEAEALGTPVMLLGASGGGRLALSLADRLLARNLQPAAIVLADTWRWRADDPRIAHTLSRLERQAEQEDRAALQAAGLNGTETSAQQGRAYRRAIDALPDPRPLPVQIHHFLADAPASIPPGFDRDWSWLGTDRYLTHPMAGGHNGLIGGAGLAANAARLRALIDAHDTAHRLRRA